jgi:hypothetical protein
MPISRDKRGMKYLLKHANVRRAGCLSYVMGEAMNTKGRRFKAIQPEPDHLLFKVVSATLDYERQFGVCFAGFAFVEIGREHENRRFVLDLQICDGLNGHETNPYFSVTHGRKVLRSIGKAAGLASIDYIDEFVGRVFVGRNMAKLIGPTGWDLGFTAEVAAVGVKAEWRWPL